MQVIITRKDHICSFEKCCLGKMVRVGTIAVTTVYKQGNLRRTFHFHPDCHTQFVLNNKDKRVREKEEILARRLSRRSDRPQGRPRRYSDPLKARNLLSLTSYHKKAGNEDKVSELEAKLKEITNAHL